MTVANGAINGGVAPGKCLKLRYVPATLPVNKLLHELTLDSKQREKSARPTIFVLSSDCEADQIVGEMLVLLLVEREIAAETLSWRLSLNQQIEMARHLEARSIFFLGYSSRGAHFSGVPKLARCKRAYRRLQLQLDSGAFPNKALLVLAKRSVTQRIAPFTPV
jgi:hypothetical protein